jgi:hypothetical protein
VTRSDDTGMQVNDVCRECNEGWMNSLETRARELLSGAMKSGQRTELSAQNTASVASWCCLRAMVIDRVNDRYFSTEQLRSFHDTQGVAPSSAHVWLAAYDMPALAVTAAADYRSFYEFRDHPERPGIEGYALTGLVGFFAFQALTFRLDEPRNLVVPVRLGPWDTAVTKIWPSPRASAGGRRSASTQIQFRSSSIDSGRLAWP